MMSEDFKSRNHYTECENCSDTFFYFQGFPDQLLSDHFSYVQRHRIFWFEKKDCGPENLGDYR